MIALALFVGLVWAGFSVEHGLCRIADAVHALAAAIQRAQGRV